MKAPYTVNIAWLDYVKRLFPGIYLEVQEQIQVTEQSGYEQEQNRLNLATRGSTSGLFLTLTENS